MYGSESEEEEEEGRYEGLRRGLGAGGSKGGGGGGEEGGGEEGGELDVLGHARLAAAAGALDDTALFADWEAHGRGVASRLLARMGYVRGRG
ncbi:hypothetical protein Agub_g5346, partial [Astrephomene gubernaculifera]